MNLDMNKPKLTLLICTHNGANTISKTLDFIASQKDIGYGTYEVLVVDNASTDETFQVASSTIKEKSLNGRVVQETKIGKINAFLKGIHEARSDLVSIIDDDNLIRPNFILYTLKAFKNHPEVGMVGSKNHIAANQPLPYWFEWTSGRYACSTPWLDDIKEITTDGVTIAQTAIIPGAGSTFKVDPVRSCIDKGYKFFNDTQRGKKMRVTGEDLELCWLIRSLGYCFAYDPRIQIDHAINPERLTKEGFDLLCKTIGAGSVGIDPFLFTHKYDTSAKRWPLKWTWQWQFLSKSKRYLYLLMSQLSSYNDKKARFLARRERIECMGSIQRILYEREKYTRHIQQVASGQWTDLRVI